MSMNTTITAYISGVEVKLDRSHDAVLAAARAGHPLYVLNPVRGWVLGNSETAARVLRSSPDALWIYAAQEGDPCVGERVAGCLCYGRYPVQCAQWGAPEEEWQASNGSSYGDYD